jgi:hypothetical protein
MKTRIANFLTTTIVLFFTIVCQAQTKPGFLPPSIDDEEIPVAKTELPVPEEGKDYVVQYFKGITDGVESRIAVKKLGYIIRPAMVQVISEDGRELTIELVKRNWDDVVRSGKTKDGKFENSFKTAMEFGIKISAKETGIPFIVAVSAGIELFPASNLFVDASTMRPSDGNEDMSTTDEADLMSQESGQSNSTLLIIIAIVLIGILALLAILVFKKKGKGAATILLLFLFTWPMNANLVTAISGSAVGGMAGNLAKGLANHYGNGGFNGADPLSEDDKNHEPEVDPRGQPSLPSSCYEITRMGRSGGSGGGGASGLSPENSPTNSGGNITLSGGMPGDMSEGEAMEDMDDEEERLKINNDYLERIAQIHEVHQVSMESAANNYSIGSQKALEEFDRMFLKDPENVDRASQLQQELEEKNARLANEYEERTTSLEIEKESALRQAEHNKANRLAALEAEQSNREDQDDPGDNDNSGEEGQPGVRAGSPTESGGANPPTTQGGSPSPSGGRDRENEAGCTCLEEAYADLLKRRYSLEKLLKIGQHTKKVTDFGISFGDDFSGVHGVSGLVWQTQRAKILESIASFDKTYDNKYKELIEKLYDTLIQIDECEKILGYENWYSHSGFIYYEFMKVRYASYK